MPSPLRASTHRSWFRLAMAAAAFVVPRAASAANTYYVATTGSDAADGSMAAPFATWAKAQSVAAAGDTVYFRAGRYKYTDATATCGGSTSAVVNAIVLSKSGASGNPINYFAYPGEKPVFDFSGITDASKYNCRQAGVRVNASWLHLKGLELTGTLQLNNLNHESWCVYVTGGSNNVFEQLDAHHNNGPGFFVQKGGNNLFLNCDSHENEDTMTSNGDGQSADGFGCHPGAGETGNVFRGCRAWWNSDDSWDFINASEVCTVENSWAWYAGYKPDAVSNGGPVSLSAGNGNGFKGGGYGDPQTDVPTPTPQHVIRFNVAFYNKASGLYANHEIVSPYFYNNTLFNNGVQVNMLGLDGTTVTSVGILRNNLAYTNNGKSLTSEMTHGGPISDTFNSWDSSLGVTVSDADFQSLSFKPPASCPEAFKPGGTPCCPPDDMTCFAGMASARQADGSLPVLPFLRLAANSDLIDKGTNLGFAYVGKAPDLGAFEYGATGGSTGGTAFGGRVGSGGTAGGAGRGGGTGGALGSGGGPATGGVPGTGGTTATGAGGGVPATGGQPGSGGTGPGAGGGSGGCSCNAAGGLPSGLLLAPVLALILARRRRRAG
jgi:hypothetical protein